MPGADQFPERFQQPREPGIGLAHETVRNLLLGEIEQRLEIGDDRSERGVVRPDLAAEASIQLGARGLRGTVGPRLDQVQHGLGLGQVEAPVEEGAPGELAGLREARAAGEDSLQQAAGRDAAAVALQLDHVFSGVAARGAEDQQHAVVQRLAAARVRETGMERTTGRRGPVRQGLRQPRHAGGDGPGIRPRNAHDGDARGAGGRGHGGDGLAGRVRSCAHFAPACNSVSHASTCWICVSQKAQLWLPGASR